jgi:NAD kinase
LQPQTHEAPLQNFDASNVDVLIVYKKSALERYTSAGIQEFLQKTDEGPLAGTFRLQQAHNNNQSCIKFVEAELTKRGISFLSLSLDNFFEQNPEFFNPLEGTISGVRPNLRLVISIGGDGTLLNVSHFVGSDICLLGVNSNPQTSVGFLCAAETSNFNLIFEKFLRMYFFSILPVNSMNKGKWGNLSKKKVT